MSGDVLLLLSHDRWWLDWSLKSSIIRRCVSEVGRMTSRSGQVLPILCHVADLFGPGGRVEKTQGGVQPRVFVERSLALTLLCL